MSKFVIDRCRCAGWSFAQLRAEAEREGLDWSTLNRLTQAGRLCRHCRPWLQQALAGGPCRFELESTTLKNGAVLEQHFCPDASTPPADD